MLTAVPGWVVPLDMMLAMAGGRIVNGMEAVPAGLVTATGPLPAPKGTTAARVVSSVTRKDEAGTPLKVTLLTVARPVPVRVTGTCGLAAAGAARDRLGATAVPTVKA